MRSLLVWIFLFVDLLAFAADPRPGLKFIENKNQWPGNFHFSARIPGGDMVVQAGKFNYYFLDEQKLQQIHEHSHNFSLQQDESQAQGDQQVRGQAIEVTFIGANPHAVPQPFGRSPEYYNYFLGSDECHWASKAYAYDGIIYPSFYNGIDLKVYSAGTNAKYDLIIAPQADPAQIIIDYQGADQLLLENGNLYAKTTLADIIEKNPFAYQLIDGKRKQITCEFHLEGNRLSFCFPEGYDPCYELVIDPLLIFSTYSGSTADNWGSTATPGEKGNLYSSGVTNHFVGTTFSGTFPATAGAFQTNYGGLYDIGILKYDSAGGQLLYASYLGGSGSESPHSLVMNASEELIVLGTTSSSNFPTTGNAYDRSFNGGTAIGHVVTYTQGADIFLARISKDGSQLLAATYLGGSSNDGLNDNASALKVNYGDQLRGDVIADDQGYIYISSVTSSSDFPGVNSIDITYNGGPSDAIVAKFNADLSELTWSMFMGGSGTDASHTLKLDGSNNLFVAGGTTSNDFPVKTGAFQTAFAGDVDGWIAKISNAGDAVYHATFTGTSEFDQVYFLDLNENEEVYVYGQTDGSFLIWPSQTAVYNKPNSGQFVQKFDNTLSSIKFSTVFGTGKGSPDISPTAFIVNECNNLYMAGWGGSLNAGSGWNTSTRGLETTSDALQRSTTGNDFYFIVLTDDATELLYATYLGGTQSRTHVDGGTSRFDKGGIVYHAVCSGCRADNTTGGASSDFPTTAGAWSRTNQSLNCNNAAFKFDLSSLKARLQTNSVKFNMPGLNKVCLPDPIVFQNFSTGGEIYEWDLGDDTYITKTDTSNIVHEYKAIGRYYVWLKAIDRGTCKGKDSTFTVVDVFNAEATIQDDDAMCKNSSYQLKSSGGAQYSWVSEDGNFQSNLASPVVSPEDTTAYYITVTEANGCIHKDTVQLDVIPVIEPEFEIVRDADCFSTPSVYVKILTDSLRDGDRLFFDFGDGTISDAEEVMHEFEEDGQYTVKLVGVREFCITEKAVSMPFLTLKIPNVITPAVRDNANDAFTIQFGEQQGITPGDFGYKVSLIIYNRWGTKVYESNDYRYDWTGEGLSSGVYFLEVTVQDHATCKSWLQLIKDN